MPWPGGGLRPLPWPGGGLRPLSWPGGGLRPYRQRNTVKKQTRTAEKWRREEDILLLQLRSMPGETPNWRSITKKLDGKTHQQCSDLVVCPFNDLQLSFLFLQLREADALRDIIKHVSFDVQVKLHFEALRHFSLARGRGPAFALTRRRPPAFALARWRPSAVVLARGNASGFCAALITILTWTCLFE